MANSPILMGISPIESGQYFQNNTNNQPSNNTNNNIGGVGMDQNNLIQQLIAAVNDPNNQSGQMQAAPTGQSGLQPFFNTPMYQVLYGDQANQIDPTERFHADPGFAFNQEQTAKQMQQYAASKGLLESGNFNIEMQKQLQGNQNQQYQTWLNQQGNLYNSYQQQLAALSGIGAQQSGADQTLQAGTNLAQLLGGYYNQTGQGIGNFQFGTGENISSLFANQGVLNANAYLNTGAAQANSLLNTFGMQAQINNNAAASAAQQQSFANQGIGALLGAQRATGGWTGARY